MTPPINPFDRGVIAADYVIAALGRDGALVVLRALRAGWLTPAELEQVEPLARGIAHLLGEELPPHMRGAA